MRKPYPSYSLLTLGGLFLAGSCSIIAEVDRTKIPQETGGTTPEGGQGTGGTSGATGGTGDRGGTAGDSGSGGTSGTAGESGGGGEPSGGTTGDGGTGPGGAGTGGEGGTPGAACGDGTIDSGEDCDDGDPPANNDGCSTTCQVEPGWDCPGTPSNCVAAMCGDRIRAGAEACDDGNGTACGTCAGNAAGTTAGCSTSIAGAAATGTINPGSAANLVDGDYFRLNDGVTTHTPVEFEFDETPGDGVTRTGAIAIVFDRAGNAAALQTAIVGAINGVTTALSITAANGTAPNVTLTNDIPGSAGNQSSGNNVVDPGFTITPMAGGAAHNCATGVGCNNDADCLNGTCSTSAHTCN